MSGPLPTPHATRLRRPSWGDARLVTGVVLLLGAVVLGALVVAGFDERAPVYAATVAIKPGDKLSPDNLTRVQVELGDAAAAYLAAGEEIPAETYALREVRAQELVPVSAVGPLAEVAVQAVTVRVETTSAAALVPGSVVDVWVSDPDPTGAQQQYVDAKLVVPRASVAWIPTDQPRFGVSADTTAVQLLVGPDDVPTLIAAQDRQARITVVPVAGSARADSS